ncbi:MAG: flavodoxin-dependent (E)-4-hydroxy-3-methylbut-2-enyl-diphosphate synthase [Firmicutes bacterium]|nr:flavodoxin-dependent (E)-4-hydroxy-3-methylbut-2-enyl-diphosphate synthase [Bacillota bacterium]
MPLITLDSSQGDIVLRNNTRAVLVGKTAIGGGAPIVVQSMTNTDTRDVKATLAQIAALKEAGCELVRLAVPDAEAAAALSKICREADLPLVADIHFDYRLALQAVEAGISKLRINPGNIGSREQVETVVSAAKERNIPIRIGVNAGSLAKPLLDKYGGRVPEALVESALQHIKILEDESFYDIVISLKASDVGTTVQAYQLIARRVQYPLHVGITEAGTAFHGTIKSSVGIGIILAMGLGDTIRVSLTGDPVEEVKVAYGILQSLGLRQRGIEIISCPTCGRTQIDLIEIAQEVENRLEDLEVPLKVAVMGCVVNGPGEAKDADIGIAGGRDKVVLFRKGKLMGQFPAEEAVDVLVKAVEELAKAMTDSNR